jgi:type II secretory pathway pseudopilin PulG
MKTRFKQSGRTLAEMTVVIAAIVLLGSFGLPAIRTFLDSFETGTGARPVISAALASARAIAAKEQKYAGIRFQKAYNPDAPFDPLKADQYMVFIVQDPSLVGTYGYGFRAVDGLQPVRLPKGFGVMDFEVVEDRNVPRPANPHIQHRLDNPSLVPNQDNFINEARELTDTTTFSIIFSPSGKLVIHGVRVRNRDSTTDAGPIISMDDTFNTLTKISDPVNPIGMFIQDDYFEDTIPNLGLGPEPSRRSFVIYDRREFKRAYEQGQGYSGYLSRLVAIYINPYTGTMIEE